LLRVSSGHWGDFGVRLLSNGATTPAEAVTHEVGEGDTIRVGSLEVAVIETPCHTVGHVCYHVGGEAVFTGDTLFVAGCGNFNTGSPRQMHDAFVKLGALPDDTLLFVGHECKTAPPTRVSAVASRRASYSICV
jgi:glyoxylase-like metal-dependent hydrolase (beta-lactamase superfamily II)